MSSFFSTIAHRSSSPIFLRSFVLILVVEAVTILTAWFLLDSNVSKWTASKAAQAVRISQEVAKSEDWSLAPTVPQSKPSALFDKYRNLLSKYSHQYFPQNEGDVYISVVRNGNAYIIDPGDQWALDENGKANQWELTAYATGKTTYNDVPYSDSSGTYIAALTPIYRNGKIVALLAAEFDSASLSEFQALVRNAFWLSIAPAIVLSLLLAYVLAAMFVEPMEIFRRIDQTVAAQTTRASGGVADPLDRLSPREQEIAELVRRGLKNREIADILVVTPETVKQHLKNIKEKTGYTRVDLAVRAEARRVLAVQGTPSPA